MTQPRFKRGPPVWKVSTHQQRNTNIPKNVLMVWGFKLFRLFTNPTQKFYCFGILEKLQDLISIESYISCKGATWNYHLSLFIYSNLCLYFIRSPKKLPLESICLSKNLPPQYREILFSLNFPIAIELNANVPRSGLWYNILNLDM